MGGGQGVEEGGGEDSWVEWGESGRRGATGTLCPSSQCGHIDEISFFCFLPLSWLFLMGLLRYML